MIKHIVMWKLKGNDQEKAAAAQKMKGLLEKLPAVISEILHLEVGINSIPGDSASDIILISHFESLEALDVYQNHPEHLKAVEFVKSVAIERRAVDYI